MNTLQNAKEALKDIQKKREIAAAIKAREERAERMRIEAERARIETLSAARRNRNYWYPLASLIIRFASLEAIPALFRHLPIMSSENHKIIPGSGVKIIKPVENCSAEDVLRDFGRAEYEIVDITLQKHKSEIPGGFQGDYYTVRFGLVPNEIVVVPESLIKFRKDRVALCGAMQHMLEKTTWKVQAFANPLFRDGKKVELEQLLNINLSAKKDLFHSNKSGEGEVEVRLRAGYHLHILRKGHPVVYKDKGEI